MMDATQDSPTPLVSLVIVCYNYGSYLPEAVASAKAQTFRDLEILVVDGGSDDPETIKVVEHLKQDPGLRVYRREKRCLAGDNRNYGIGLGAGKYICCLDADDMLRPSYIEKAVMLVESLGVDIVSTSRSEFGGQGRVAMLKRQPVLEDVLKENQMNTVSLFTRAIWQKAGEYDDFGLGTEHIHEDWHFWMKCMTVGAKVYNLAYEGLFRYRVHAKASLSQQSGQVPHLKHQTAFINEAYQDLVEQGIEDRDSGRREITVKPGALESLAKRQRGENTNSVMIVVPCFDLDTVERLIEPMTKTLSARFGRIVLVAMERYEDREDRLGLRLDAITPYHYDYPRSFSKLDPREFLNYLLQAYSVQTLQILDNAAAQVVAELKASQPEIEIVDSESIKFVSSPKQEDLRKLCIVCDGERNLNSAGAEVWLLSIRNRDGYIIRSDLFRGEAPVAWTVVNSEASPLGKALLTSGPATLDLELPEGSTLQFLRHDWSGKVTLEYARERKTIDLYSEVSTTEIVNL